MPFKVGNSGWQVVATRFGDTWIKCFVPTGEFLCKSLSPRHDFSSRQVACTHLKRIWFSATSWGDKSCRWGKELHKNYPVHTRRFVVPTCGLITRPVHRKWFIAVTRCSDMSPSVPTIIWEVHALLFPYRWHYYLLSQWFLNCLFPSPFS